MSSIYNSTLNSNNKIHDIHDGLNDSPNSASGLPVSSVAANVNDNNEQDNKSIISNTSSIPIPSLAEISLLRELSFIFLICLGQLLTQSGVAQTINPASEIGKTFGIEDSPGEISWFSASFSLTVGTFILILGRIGDILEYGYKKIFIFGYCWYAVWSLVAGFSGFSSSRVFFDVARGLQGIGPSLIMPQAIALIASYYPNGKRKNLAMCAFGSVAPSGFVLGALFSGIFTQLVWWPYLFWVNGIVCFIIAVLSYFIIPRNIGSKSNGSFDYIGSFFGVSGLILINFAWNQGPNVGWDVPYVYILLIIGFLSILCFIISTYKVKDPLIPANALKGETGLLLGCISASWATFGIWLYYSFRWADTVDNLKPIMRAVEFIPTALVGFMASSLTAILMPRIPSSAIMLISMLAFFTGITIMGTRHVGQIYWGQKFVSLLIEPFGMDMSFPAACIILSNALPKSSQGIAGSLVSTFVNYSISIGLGMAGTVEYYSIKNKDQNSLDTRIYGMRKAFYFGMGLSGLGVLVSLYFFYLQVYRTPRKIEEQNAQQDTEKDDTDSHSDED